MNSSVVFEKKHLRFARLDEQCTKLSRASTELAFLEKARNTEAFIYVGKRAGKIDSIEKVSGTARYLEDMKIDGMAHARIVGSKVSHGLIRKIDLSEAERVSGVLGFVTSRDVPGESLIGYIPEMPVLATEKVRYVGEPIVIVIARDSESAFEASSKVHIEIEPLPILTDPIQSMETRDILIHKESGSNIAFNMRISKGDVNSALEKAAVTVENEYKIAARDHGYIERESAIGIPEEDNGLTVIVQQQNPHVVQRNVAKVLGIPKDRVRIIQPYIGGSFGGKNDMGIILGSQVALATHKLRKPILLSYSREESLQRHSKGESATVNYLTAASRDGKLLAAKVKLVIDSGAYAIRSPLVIWRTAVQITGPYEIPNVDLKGYCVYTNKVYVGSFRGFGGTTAAFAAESQLDAIASKLDISPLELRLRNLLRPGSVTTTGQKIDDDIDFERTLRELADSSKWEARGYGAAQDGSIRHGIGLGCSWHGIGIGWGSPSKEKGKIVDWSSAIITVNEDGHVIIQTGIVEMGQGTNTALTQIASETLSLPLNKISVKTGSSIAPETGGTHASRGLSHGGLAVVKACQDLKQTLLQIASNELGFDVNNLTFNKGEVYSGTVRAGLTWNDLVTIAHKKAIPLGTSVRVDIPREEFDPDDGIGQVFLTFSFSATIAEVQVDTLTGEVKATKLWPAVAAGRIVNPTIAEDQVVGGTIFGLGTALMEEVLFDDDGGVANDSFSTYLLPTMPDTPEIANPLFIEDVSKYGVFGAKGIGEVIPSSIPPAISSAIHDATGVQMTEMPFTKERVWQKLKCNVAFETMKLTESGSR
jgi:CO/xanthine dehydrogenase Mo-binding subunit